MVWMWPQPLGSDMDPHVNPVPCPPYGGTSVLLVALPDPPYLSLCDLAPGFTPQHISNQTSCPGLCSWTSITSLHLAFLCRKFHSTATHHSPPAPFSSSSPPVSPCHVTVTLWNLDNCRSLQPALSSLSAPNISSRVFARSSFSPQLSKQPPGSPTAQPIMTSPNALPWSRPISSHSRDSSPSSASQPLVSPFNVDRRSF